MSNKKKLELLLSLLLLTGFFGELMAGEAASPTPAPTGRGATRTFSVAADTPRTERTVEVRLTEYAIEMPLRLSAGPTVFKVTNDGGMYHRFEIEGKGIEKELESGVDAGETKMLELNLEPGSYEVYCPVRGHKKAGMFLRVQIT